jgi:hypothetical protein
MHAECMNDLSIRWKGIVTSEQNPELELWLPSNIAAGARKQKIKDRRYEYNSALPLAIYPRKDNKAPSRYKRRKS